MTSWACRQALSYFSHPREVCHDSAISFLGPSAAASPAPLQTDRWLWEGRGQDQRRSQRPTLGLCWCSFAWQTRNPFAPPAPFFSDAQGVFKPLLRAPRGGAPNRIQIWTASGRHRWIWTALKLRSVCAPSLPAAPSSGARALTAAPRAASASPPLSPAKSTKTTQASLPLRLLRSRSLFSFFSSALC